MELYDHYNHRYDQEIISFRREITLHRNRREDIHFIIFRIKYFDSHGYHMGTHSHTYTISLDEYAFFSKLLRKTKYECYDRVSRPSMTKAVYRRKKLIDPFYSETTTK